MSRKMIGSRDCISTLIPGTSFYGGPGVALRRNIRDSYSEQQQLSPIPSFVLH
jgi:hypothetical protein